MDFGAAGTLGLRAVWALSLPGKVAPDSAGIMIHDTVRNIMKECDRWKS
jgi:dipicolinate synthase subunit A